MSKEVRNVKKGKIDFVFSQTQSGLKKIFVPIYKFAIKKDYFITRTKQNKNISGIKINAKCFIYLYTSILVLLLLHKSC